MAKSIPISATTSYLVPFGNVLVKGVTLAGAAATCVLEIFDGLIDSVSTYVIASGGSGYAVGDYVTLATGEFGTTGSRAVFKVTQVDDNSPSSSISSSPSLSISSSVSLSTSPSASASPSTSISSSISTSISSSPSSSTSPSGSASPSTSISLSPSPSESPSTSISLSPSTSISSSVSLSPSTSISLSPSTSISSSVSASLSPSVGSGRITAIELDPRNPGGGYTAGNTYSIASTTGSGTSATITVSTVTDLGTSIAKLQTTANLSAAPLESYCGILAANGVSARISGSGAKGHLIYE